MSGGKLVRALDSVGDWTFGKGTNDYLTQNPMVAQNIQTRLQSFLGNCFFDTGAGIDWFNLLGSKDLTDLNKAIKTVILNTQWVIAIEEVSSVLGANRNLSVEYTVTTVFGGSINGVVDFGFLLTESGSIIDTEGGSGLLG